jgi:ankyrin repeat protein
MLLHNDGILPKILNYCGPKLLAAAISARDERLVCFLRQNNADKDLSETASLENTPFHAHIAEPMRPESDLNCAISDDPSFSSSFGHGGFRESTTPYSPLQAAVRTQQVSIVRDLIVSRGADVNYLGDSIFGRTPLQYAVELGNMEIFNLLIEHGADVNAPAAGHRGATALQIAAIQGYIGIARKLLDLGSDVNQDPADKNGRTASMGAAENGRIDVLQLLLDEGAHVVGEYEGYYYEAVALAEGRGHYAAARLLKLFKDSAELGTS